MRLELEDCFVCVVVFVFVGFVVFVVDFGIVLVFVAVLLYRIVWYCCLSLLILFTSVNWDECKLSVV